MITLKTLTESEVWLLLYLQSRAVNYGGRVSRVYIGRDDWKTIEKWKKEGFIQFGAIAEGSISNQAEVYWCTLSEEAWTLSFAASRDKFERLYKQRQWKIAEEGTFWSERDIQIKEIEQKGGKRK